LAIVAVLAAVLGAPALPVAAQPEGAPPDAEPTSGAEIVFGQATAPGQFRFLVGLLNRSVDDEFQAQFCGGSLIGPRRVLTAAHCVTQTGTTNVISPTSLDVLVGTHLLDGSGQRVNVRAIHVHPGWNPSSSANDLAALDLAQAVNQPLIRPATPAQAGRAAAGASTTVTGWGRIDPTNNVFPIEQRMGTAVVQPRATCESDYPGPTFEYFHNLNVCVGVPGAPGSCSGDSGGPLFTTDLPRVQVGIVSFGRINCGTASSVYARVSRYSSSNDAFGQPITIPQAGGLRSAKTFTASKQTGEPAHAAGNRGGASVWFNWRAPRTRNVTISTGGSNFDTLLGVYRGPAVNSLTPVARNDDVVPGVLTSRVSFRAIQGALYRIAVDGYNGAFGNANVRVT
jgi:hypothetical protein